MTEPAGARGSAARSGRQAAGAPEGFTLVELLMVVMIIGILARIALPAYQNLTLRARAAQAVGDINAVRVAAFSYHADTGRWPADVNRGVLPSELVPYLGERFSFEREGYLLDWDNWMLPDGTPMQSGVNTLLGVSIATDNAALGHALVGMVGESVARYTINEHYTFIIASN